MSLRLWLPLDGNGDNKGITGTVLSGSPASWGNGPISKCATFNNNVSNVIYNNTNMYNYINEPFSWCMWLKKDYASKTANAMYAFTVGRADAGGRGYGCRIASTSKVNCVFGTSEWEISGITDNEWHHIAFVRSGTNIKLYRDGERILDTTFAGTLPTYSDGNGIGVGCFHYGSDIYPLIGSVADFRIYDHALSKLEVKEIYRNMVLHLPMSGAGAHGVGSNLANVVWCDPYAVTLGTYAAYLSYNGTALSSDTFFGLQVGETYTYSAYITAPSNKKVAVRAEYHTNDSTRTSVIGNYIEAGESGWSKVTDTITEAKRNYTYLKLLINSGNTSVTANATVYVSKLKIERSSSRTDWVPPGTRHISDTSGHSRIVTTSSTHPTLLNYTSGSPMFNGCVNFASGNYIRVADPISASANAFSISVWFKTTNASASQCIWNGRTSVGGPVAVFLVSSKFRFDDSGQTSPSTTISANTWYHVVCTWKSGGNKKIYLNGTQISSVTAGTLSGKANSYATIGVSSNADSAGSGNQFLGQMSDFRIYGSELSADDVADMYRKGASIDNTGKVHCALVEGNSSVSAKKGNLLTCGEVNEFGRTQLLYTGDTNTELRNPKTEKGYTPSTANNSTTNFGAVLHFPTATRNYHLEMDFTWTDFTGIDTSTFGCQFQGHTAKTGGTASYSNPMTNALTAQMSPKTLITGTLTGGTYHYSVNFTIAESYWKDKYEWANLGFMTNYSNGTATISVKNLLCYSTGTTTSLRKNGTAEVNSVVEV